MIHKILFFEKEDFLDRYHTPFFLFLLPPDIYLSIENVKSSKMNKSKNKWSGTIHTNNERNSNNDKDKSKGDWCENTNYTEKNTERSNYNSQTQMKTHDLSHPWYPMSCFKNIMDFVDEESSWHKKIGK